MSYANIYDKFVARVWKMLAFCARYGHQPISELLKLPRPKLHHFCKALATLIQEESKKPLGSFGESTAGGGG